MNSATTYNKAESSSPTKLAPETIRIRNALIEKFSDQPIEEFNEFLQRTLQVETDDLKRLGLLAARVHLLRQKVLNLKAFIRDEAMTKPRAVDLRRSQYENVDDSPDTGEELPDEVEEIAGWQSLQMIEPGEINGVRFFKGTVINAKMEDADRLISSGKAIVIDEEGNPIEPNADSPDITQNTLVEDQKNIEQSNPNPLEGATNSAVIEMSQSGEESAKNIEQVASSNDSENDKQTTKETSLSEAQIEESFKKLAPSNDSENEKSTAKETNLSEAQIEESFEKLVPNGDGDGDGGGGVSIPVEPRPSETDADDNKT